MCMPLYMALKNVDWDSYLFIESVVSGSRAVGFRRLNRR